VASHLIRAGATTGGGWSGGWQGLVLRIEERGDVFSSIRVSSSILKRSLLYSPIYAPPEGTDR
jgi:hypothetical protein